MHLIHAHIALNASCVICFTAVIYEALECLTVLYYQGFNMVFDFSGKKILVTGATRGVGRALTKSLVDAGAIVYGLGRNQELLDSLVKECPTVHPIKGDLADWDAIRQELEKLPPMNGLVNNAGVTLPCIPSLDASKDMITRTFDVNVMAAINVTQVIGKKMVETGQGGSIVNVSSIGGINPLRETMAYCMSKAALDMLTKQFALELGPHKIRVNSVNPTVVYTGMGIDFVRDQAKAGKLKDHTPLGRFAEIRESVDPIMYLLSDYSSMVTGTINPIEGGLLSNISV